MSDWLRAVVWDLGRAFLDLRYLPGLLALKLNRALLDFHGPVDVSPKPPVCLARHKGKERFVPWPCDEWEKLAHEQRKIKARLPKGWA